MKFGDLTFQEIREAAESGSLAIVPTGCTEQQGPHSPVDFDTWFVEQVCLAAAARAREAHGVESLVLPAMPFGPTPEHRNFRSGFVDLPQQLHEAVLSSVLESLAEQGFRMILIWRGCGQHDLSHVVDRFNFDFKERAKAYHPEPPYHGIWDRVGDPDVAGGHAGGFATSIALHLRPESVRKGSIPEPELADVEWNDPHLDFSAYSSSGVIGDATIASAELGEVLWHEVVGEVAEIIWKVAAGAEDPELS